MNTVLMSGGGLQTVVPLQVIYLDFDGANTAYHGEALTIDGVTVQNSGLTAAQITTLTDQLNEAYLSNVRFVTERPESGDYSTVYVGATDAFTYHGLAETIDEGNQNHNDNAFVNLHGDESLTTIQEIISHEVDHLLGTLDHGGDGLAAYGYRYDVSSGVTSTSITLNNDSMYVSNGGVASSTTVNSGSYMYISSGGTANNTTVNSNGSMFIFSEGTASSSIVNFGGRLDIYSGIANNTTVNSNGAMYVSSGGMADHTIIHGNVYISSGGTANNTTVNYNGSMFISGGVANNTNMTGSMFLIQGGNASNTIINGGNMTISSGGIADHTTVKGWGYMRISSGGTANNTTMNSNGAMYVFSGGTANSCTVNSGCRLDIYSGIANNTTVNSNGSMCIDDGEANNTTVNSNGSMFIYGVANNTTMTGSMFLIQRGIANSTTVNSYGAMYISAGSIAKSTMMNGNMYISSGGTANNTTVNSYGAMYISSGGTVNNNTINADGSMTILSGGTANNTTVNPSGAVILSGGVANSTIINVGYMTVLSGGTANDTIVNYDEWGGVQISSGGTANGTIINSGSMIVYSGGVASNTTVNDQGELYVYSEGMANNITINSGSLIVRSGGSALNVDWTPCVGEIKTEEGAYVTYQSSYSGCYIGYNYQLQSQAMTMTGSVISGSVCIMSGGLAKDVTTANGGIIYIYSAGVTENATVNDGMYISSGGVANGTVIDINGAVYVLFGGKANNTVIASDGYMYITPGGIAHNTTVNGGLDIYSGGTATDVTVNFGGWLDISSGSKMTGSLTIAAGASVTADAGGEINFDVSKRTASDGYLINNLSLISGAPDYTITVSVTQSAGIYKLAQGANNFTQTISIGNETSTLGRLSVNGAAVKNGGYEYSLLQNSGNLSLSVILSDKVAPTITSIKATPTDQTNGNVTVSAVFGDDTGLALSQYKIDGGDWTNYTGAFIVTNNSAIYFKAVDTSGNETIKEYVVSNIDKVAPSITDISANQTGLTNQNVLVSAVFADNMALALSQYKIGNGNWTNYTGAITVSSNATVYFKAVDTSGNEATAEYEVKNILAVDSKGPGAVTPVAKVNKYDATVSWLAPATQDKAKIVSYDVYVNGQLTFTKGPSLSLKAMQISTGNTVQVRALDSLGRYGALSNIITFDIKDVTAPVLGKITTSLNQYSAIVGYSGTDNVGVDHYQVKCGGQTQTLAGTSATFNHLAIGVNNVEVIAYDAAGNASKAATARITVKDVTAPDNVTGLATPTVDSKYKATLSWSAGVDNSGSVASYEIQLDNGKILKSTKTSLAINNLAVGQHSYQVRAIDKAKNVGEWSAAKAFTVLDTTAPGTVSAKAVVAQNSVLLSWKASKDNVGVTGYQVWIGASPSTMTMEQALSADQLSCVLSSVPKGIYYMDVRAIDAANNASVSKPAKVTVTTSLPVNNFAMSASSSDLLAWSASTQTPFALASGL